MDKQKPTFRKDLEAEFQKTDVYNAYIHSAEWHTHRGLRLDYDGHKCVVCGREATEDNPIDVHHLTYRHFMHEPIEDLVTMCRECHNFAGKLKTTPKAPRMGNNFMAFAIEDACSQAPLIFEYLLKIRGSSWNALRALSKADGKTFGGQRNRWEAWNPLELAIKALVTARYSPLIHSEDRMDIMRQAVQERVLITCIGWTERLLRNNTQAELYETGHFVWKDLFGNGQGPKAAQQLGIEIKELYTICEADKAKNASKGPSLEEAVYFYCEYDARLGITPPPGLKSLSEEDYETLTKIAENALAEMARHSA